MVTLAKQKFVKLDAVVGRSGVNTKPCIRISSCMIYDVTKEETGVQSCSQCPVRNALAFVVANNLNPGNAKHTGFFVLRAVGDYTQSSSGIKVDADATEAFQKLKGPKHNRIHRYLIFKFSDKYDRVVLHKAGPRDATFDNFLADMEELKNRAAYIFYDIDFNTADGVREKVISIAWVSDNEGRGKDKMLISTTKKNVMSATDVDKFFQINEWDELDMENFIKLVSDNKAS